MHFSRKVSVPHDASGIHLEFEARNAVKGGCLSIHLQVDVSSIAWVV
jgi:hypothetical protein